MRFDLAAASSQDLELIPGIGKKWGKKIIETAKKTDEKIDWREVPGLTEKACAGLEKWVYQKETEALHDRTDMADP